MLCERILYLDQVVGRCAELFEQVSALGGEGIVSKRRGRPYRGGESRDWLKCKVHEIGEFIVTGFQELGEGRLEALHVAEERDGRFYPAGQVRFGFAGRGLWNELDSRRAGAAVSGVFPIAPVMPATVKFFGRYKRGAIRDGVLIPIRDVSVKPATARWSCDSDAVVAAFDTETNWTTEHETSPHVGAGFACNRAGIARGPITRAFTTAAVPLLQH